MAITGIDTIDGKQIIAAGAVSAKSAEMAYNDENGNPITGYLTAVPEGYATTADLTGKQDTLTFGYNESNAISSINESAIGGGSAPTYGYTDNGLISSIDTSGLYATNAGTAASANHLRYNGTMGENVVQSYNSNNFYYMPMISPFGKPAGIFSPLQYATGACLVMDGGSFAAYFKGNEWYVSNTAIGQALRGEVHASRGVHISGATTAGNGFDLSIKSVSGVNYTGSWKYGHDEDAALRAVSSCDMHESAFEYDSNDKISGYNGSAFAGGGEVPEGVMSESGLEYNAVNEISGYNGSAIAQYGAEKQWLVHDDTLVHAANSAQYALGVNLSAVAQLLGVDETVLYSGAFLAQTNNTATITEPITNFETIKIYASRDNNQRAPIASEFQVISSTDAPYCIENTFYNSTGAFYNDRAQINFNNTTVRCILDVRLTYSTTGFTINTGAPLTVSKIIGIGRKQ